MSSTAERLDLEALAKIRFVAIVLPILGTFGGVLRASGQTEATVLMVVVPLMFVSFFGWRFTRGLRSFRQMTADSEKRFWNERDALLAQRLREQIEAQREELRAIRLRQQAEQERLLRQHPSAEQLARLMERHRSEYEAVLNRRTA